jgi:hypothetical protein
VALPDGSSIPSPIGDSTGGQHWVIDVVRRHERDMGHQRHPVGMTAQFPVPDQARVTTRCSTAGRLGLTRLRRRNLHRPLGHRPTGRRRHQGGDQRHRPLRPGGGDALWRGGRSCAATTRS